MSNYQLEIKQVLDYPRCRIYRQFIQSLMEDRSIRTGGSSGLFYYAILCSYANFRTSYRTSLDDEVRHIDKLFKKLISDNNLTPVVFHSLRHCSASMKLRIGGGNIKAVQGDTGHSQSRMVTDLYAHINDEDRRILAKKVDEQFFQTSSKTKIPATTDDATIAFKLLQENPDIAKLLIATLQKSSA